MATSMAHQWPNTRDRPNSVQGLGEDEAVYFSGWILSSVAVLVTILLLWYFQVSRV
jgi:hypothetical protein